MSKVVVAIKEIGGVEQKRLLGVFDSTWRIFVETEPGNATEIDPSEHESNAKVYKEFEITNAMFHIDEKPETEFYQCKSYYDNNNQLQDCTCGKCEGTSKDLSIVSAGTSEVHKKVEPFYFSSESYQEKLSETRLKINEIINWINSQEEKV